MKALDRAGADSPAIESALAQSVANETRSVAGVLPSFDESLAHLLREAWSLSFDEYGDGAVSPVRFFETVARRGDAWPRLVAALPTFDRIDLASLASAARPGGASRRFLPARRRPTSNIPNCPVTGTTWLRRLAPASSTP